MTATLDATIRGVNMTTMRPSPRRRARPRARCGADNGAARSARRANPDRNGLGPDRGRFGLGSVRRVAGGLHLSGRPARCAARRLSPSTPMRYKRSHGWHVGSGWIVDVLAARRARRLWRLGGHGEHQRIVDLGRTRHVHQRRNDHRYTHHHARHDLHQRRRCQRRKHPRDDDRPRQRRRHDDQHRRTRHQHRRTRPVLRRRQHRPRRGLRRRSGQRRRGHLHHPVPATRLRRRLRPGR
jgi:hypothetical protein